MRTWLPSGSKATRLAGPVLRHIPRIENRHTRLFKIPPVTGNKRQAVVKSGRPDNQVGL